jgi:transcriptional regulator with XRE-family HTH domain
MKRERIARPNLQLRRQREQRGWSQRYLAQQIGAPTPFYVSRWENGVSRPSPYYREKLCTLFGKDAYELELLEQAGAASSDDDCLITQEQVTRASGGLWSVSLKRNPFFTGREEAFSHLRELLASGSIHSYAVTGLAGIGKTQTVIEYAYRYRDSYGAIFFVRADTPGTFFEDLNAIAHALELTVADDQDERCVVDLVRRWLEMNESWLLMFDDVKDFELVYSLLPSRGCGHILMTTRAQAMGPLARRFTLERMAVEEGALFLLRRTKVLGRETSFEYAREVDRVAAGEVARLMDGMPLALDQAGAYIEETSCTLSHYLDLYRRHRLVLLQQRGSFHFDHPESVALTWARSFNEVKQVSAAAADLLKLCAFLHPEDIPEELFLKGASLEGLSSEFATLNSIELNNTIGCLLKYSLLQRDAGGHTLSIHRLLQCVLRDMLGNEGQRLWAERTVRLLDLAFPGSAPSGVDGEQCCRRYMQHIYTCVTLIEQWDLLLPEAVRLLYRAGRFLWESECYEPAEALLLQALTVCKRILGPEHPEVAAYLQSLTLLYREQRKCAQAESLYGRALKIYEDAAPY